MERALKAHGWRIALVLGGLVTLFGGSQHPDAESAGKSLREELAIMTSDRSWVPSHLALLVSILLITGGLLAARRAAGWPLPALGALRFAGVAMALYSVEAAFHLAAVLDSDRLAAGDFAPIAFTHVALAAVLYPVSGFAIAGLAWKLLPSWSLPQRPFAVAGMIGGLLHAVSVPATLVFTETETTVLFAFAALLIAVFAVSVGLVGIRAWRPAGERSPAAAVLA